ncbi:hypothetical protein B7P43_G05688 [Cryptotermes secundus]|uniref:CCHC-type domain-containing protein n=1 Tax=Cryptotermes secundus TaxID=105785 RepID=A0A2J7QXQ2_9NEOP|nr:hypothetical protein B7P43_G05688 [Cryptotermes secundus]
MPLKWIHDLSREEAERLAVELSVPVQGTLDKLHKRVKEKWKVLETYLPPQRADKSDVAMHTGESSDSRLSSVQGHVTYSQIKLRAKVVTDLVKGIPVLSDAEPEAVLQFLIRASEVYDLGLVTDEEFLALLVARTTGRFTQIISGHLSASANWGVVRSELRSTFLPPRIREGLLTKYVLERFHFVAEDLSKYIMSVVAAANILDYDVPESALVDRLVQNIHPNVRSQLVFLHKPTSIKELYALAGQVAEGRAIEERRIRAERSGSTDMVQQSSRGSRPVSMAVGQTRRFGLNSAKCWKCSGRGHLKKDCPSSDVSVGEGIGGNDGGTR